MNGFQVHGTGESKVTNRVTKMSNCQELLSDCHWEDVH